MIGDSLQKFKSADFFQKIIFLNIITYLFYFISSVIGYNSQILSFFSVEKNFLSNPWSIFTYAFLHQNIFDLIFMMFLLKFSSDAIINLIGKKIPINIFVIGVFFGALFFIFFSKNNSQLIGSSAGISALLFFLFFLSPNYELNIFRFNVKFKYLMYFLFLIDFFRMSSGYSGVYAHIGGYVVGGIYYYYMYGKTTKSTNKPKSRYRKQLLSEQKKIDDILDKIGQSGYESLSDEEKNFLSKKGDNK